MSQPGGEDTQLYVQQDLTLSQLSKAVGVNHYYLSQYFASQGTSYYAYIHDLRVRHFIARYRELAAAHEPIVAQQLAQESGYHSYSTFSTAFKQRMGQSVAAWMREEVSSTGLCATAWRTGAGWASTARGT